MNIEIDMKRKKKQTTLSQTNKYYKHLNINSSIRKCKYSSKNKSDGRSTDEAAKKFQLKLNKNLWPLVKQM